MFVTEINNKDKENTPFDNNISNKIQNQLEVQPINVEADDQQDKQERPRNGVFSLSLLFISVTNILGVGVGPKK
jgi:DNA topoisomerase IA